MNQIELSGVVRRASEYRETEDGIHAAYLTLSFDRDGHLIHVMGLHAAANKLKDFEPGDGLKVTGKLIWLEGTGMVVLAEEVRKWKTAVIEPNARFFGTPKRRRLSPNDAA